MCVSPMTEMDCRNEFKVLRSLHVYVASHLYVMAALPFVFNTQILLCFLSGAHPIPIHWTINFTCTTKRWIQTKEKKRKSYWKCVKCECSEYFERMTKPHAHFLFSCLLFLFRIHNYGMHFTMQIVQCKLHVTTDTTIDLCIICLHKLYFLSISFSYSR